jgi:hypothetical protein
MKNYDAVFFIFWIGLGLFVMFISNKYGLGRFDNPGPGLMPFLFGLFLFLISFYLLMEVFYKRVMRDTSGVRIKDKKDQISFKKVSLVLGSLFAYAVLLEPFGYVLTTLLTMVFLFWNIGVKRWRSILFAAGLTVLTTYFLFTFLGVRFPLGVLGFLG